MKKQMNIFLLAIFTIILLPLVQAFPYDRLIVDIGPKISLTLVAACNNTTYIKNYLKNSLTNYKDIYINKLDKNICEVTVIIDSWNKSVFSYDVSPLLRLVNNTTLQYVVKTDKYLNIEEFNPKEKVVSSGNVYVKVSVNYNKIREALFILLGIPLISGITLLGYIKRKARKVSSYDEKVKAISSIKKASVFHIIIVVSCFIISLYFYDLPAGITFITNIPLEASVAGTIILMFMQMFTPLIYAMKYTSRLYGKEKLQRRDYVYTGILMSSFMLICLIIFGIIAFTPENVFEFLSNVPKPVQVLFWFTIGFGVAHIIITLVNRFVYKRLEKPIEPWIIDMVQELTKKFNVKRFKRIRKIETLGGKVANAVVTGIFNKELIITERLVEVLNKEELKAILAHEIAHKKQRHIEIILLSWFIFGILIFTGMSYLFDYIHKRSYENEVVMNYFSLLWFILFILGYSGLILLTRYIQRRVERNADIEASKIIDPKVYIKALAKITIVNLIPIDKKGFDVFSTHPSMFKRVYEVGRRNNLSNEEISKIIHEAYDEIQSTYSNP